jgi:hypothetical protein
MPRWTVYAAAVVLVVAAAAVAGHFARSSQEWEHRASSALASADTMRVRADSLVAVADAADERARQLAIVADEVGRQVRERVVAVRGVAVPDTCAPFVVPRDRIIDTLLLVSDDWRLALDEQIRSGAALRGANLSLQMAVDSLYDVLDDRPTRRRFTLIPKVGVGGFAGVCVGGTPCAGAGITLSWSTP